LLHADTCTCRSSATRQLQEPLSISITKSPVFAAYPLTYLKARCATLAHAAPHCATRVPTSR
jgi:hypothetical protein